MQASLAVWGWRYAVHDISKGAPELQVHAVPCIADHEVPAHTFPQFVDSQALPMPDNGATSASTGPITPALFPGPVQATLQTVACRYAIMFGDALESLKMIDIMGGLAEAKLPFHCAHGRPTTACLLDRFALYKILQGRKRAVPSFLGRYAEVSDRSLKQRLNAQLPA